MRWMQLAGGPPGRRWRTPRRCRPLRRLFGLTVDAVVGELRLGCVVPGRTEQMVGVISCRQDLHWPRILTGPDQPTPDNLARFPSRAARVLHSVADSVRSSTVMCMA